MVATGVGATKIPVFHCFIPRARHEHGVAGGLDEAAHPHTLFVGCDLLSLGGIRGEIDELGCFVDTGAGDFGTILMRRRERESV
ncbi:hypothetical protein HC762_01520 [bacterium]|nr:hypothetical protein [bacterium]